MRMQKRNHCEQCGRCCMVFEIGPLKACETFGLEVYKDTFFKDAFHIQKTRPGWLENWAKQGACIYLGENLRCTIYNNRPDLCMEYFCRDEDGKLKDRFMNARRGVAKPSTWTDYDMETFGHLLTEEETDKE